MRYGSSSITSHNTTRENNLKLSLTNVIIFHVKMLTVKTSLTLKSLMLEFDDKSFSTDGSKPSNTIVNIS